MLLVTGAKSPSLRVNCYTSLVEEHSGFDIATCTTKPHCLASLLITHHLFEGFYGFIQLHISFLISIKAHRCLTRSVIVFWHIVTMYKIIILMWLFRLKKYWNRSTYTTKLCVQCQAAFKRIPLNWSRTLIYFLIALNVLPHSFSNIWQVISRLYRRHLPWQCYAL